MKIKSFKYVLLACVSTIVVSGNMAYVSSNRINDKVINASGTTQLNTVITNTNLGNVYWGKTITPTARQLNSILKINNNADGSKDANWHPNQWTFNNVTVNASSGAGTATVQVVSWSPDYDTTSGNSVAIQWQQNEPTDKVSLGSTFNFSGQTVVNGYWLQDCEVSNAEILKAFDSQFGIGNSFDINQIQVSILSSDPQSKNGEILIRPIDNSNYYNSYSASDPTSYLRTKYSGANETYFTYSDDWTDPTIKGKVLTGYSQIPQQDTTLIIPSEVEVIVDDAFINLATTNPNITTIVFGNNQRLEIRENAFGNNPYITNVRADQANVEYLAASAFIGSPWWDINVQEISSESDGSSLGYKYINPGIFGNTTSSNKLTWIIGPSDDWSTVATDSTANVLKKPTAPFAYASKSFYQNTLIKNNTSNNFEGVYYICDYAFAGATRLQTLYNYTGYNNPINVGGRYFGKSAFAGCTALNMNSSGNAGESKAFNQLYYIGDNCFDGCTNWGQGNTGAQGTTLLIYGFPKSGGYIGAYAFRNNNVGLGLSFANYSYPPYIHPEAFTGYTRLYFMSNNIMYKDSSAGSYSTNFVNRINADPEIKQMYQNTYALWANTTQVSVYDLLQCYWYRSNVMSTSTLGNYYAPLNPVVDISSLSISEQTTAKLDPQYYFYRNNFFPNQHLTISGLAVDQNIINVTEQTETIGFSYQLSPGVNAAVGTYEIYVSDHINNKSHPVTITIVF